MKYLKILFTGLLLSAVSLQVTAQQWQWLKRMGQRYDAAVLAGTAYDIYADVPNNLLMDKNGDLILSGIVGRYPDTCLGLQTGSCTADSAGSRRFNPIIAKYDCAGHMIWRKYIGFRSQDPNLQTMNRNGANAPHVILNYSRSEIIIVDAIFTGDAQYPSTYSFGDTTVQISYQNWTGFTNILAKLDLDGHLLFLKTAPITSGIPYFSSFDQNQPFIYATPGEDIIGLASYKDLRSLVPTFRMFDDSVMASTPPSYSGLLPENMIYAYRMDSVGHMKWASAVASDNVLFKRFFADGNDNISIEINAFITTRSDSFSIGRLKRKNPAGGATGAESYYCLLHVANNGSIGNAYIPSPGRGYLPGPVLTHMEYTDHEGNSYISAFGMAEHDSCLGIPLHRDYYLGHDSHDSIVSMLIKVDSNLHPIWHYNTNDSVRVVYGDSGTYQIFGTCQFGNYGEDKDNHVYVPIVLGPDTFHWNGQRLSVPIAAPLWSEYGREGFAIVDKTTARIAGYHLLDSQLQPGSATTYGLKNYGFSHPVVDAQGNFYAANFVEGYQIAGHDTIAAYPGGRDGVDIGLWKWGLDCRTDTSLLSPLGYADSLRADGVSTSQIRVQWVDSATYETGYRIYRSRDGQTAWQLIDSVSTGTSTYVDGGLPQSTIYYYRVAAINGSLQAPGYSNIDSGQTWLQTSVSEEKKNAWLNVYPNPASSVLTLDYTTDVPDEVQIELHDMMGRLVYSNPAHVREGYQQYRVDVKGDTPGSYYLSISGPYTSAHSVITIVR